MVKQVSTRLLRGGGGSGERKKVDDIPRSIPITAPCTFPSVDSYRAKLEPRGFRIGAAHREAVVVARGSWDMGQYAKAEPEVGGNHDVGALTALVKRAADIILSAGCVWD